MQLHTVHIHCITYWFSTLEAYVSKAVLILQKYRVNLFTLRTCCSCFITCCLCVFVMSFFMFCIVLGFTENPITAPLDKL